MKLRIVPLLLSLALMMGCASDFQSTGSGSSTVVNSSSDTSSQQAIEQINQQTALDAANAAAQQQFNDAMAATQQTMNNATNGQPLHDP